MEPHPFEEELGSICHCDVLLTGREDGRLLKPINYHKYIIIAFLGGSKTRHVIHRDGFPSPLGSRKRGV
jgi:hypothetical protein